MNQTPNSTAKKQQREPLPLSTFCRTDMASELYKSSEGIKGEGENGNKARIHEAEWEDPYTLRDSGMHYEERMHGDIRVEKLVVSGEAASHKLGKSIGTYYTVHTGELRFLSGKSYHDALTAVRETLVDAVHTYLPEFRMPSANPYGEGARFQTSIDSPGVVAQDRSSVSPEWDQQGHLYNVPPSFLSAVQTERTGEDSKGVPEVTSSQTEEEPLFISNPDLSAITDIPPAPLPENPKLFRSHSILVVGLGNPQLTPDALGPACAARLHVTRHLVDDACCEENGNGQTKSDSGAAEDAGSLSVCGIHKLSALTPMVLGQTGIETLELVRGAVRSVKPDLVILIDALAAAETESLVRCVQIATTGIHPGGGVGNKRQPLVAETLGVPVITIGVPTVIGASTLVYRALEETGILSQMDGSKTAETQTEMQQKETAQLQKILERVDIGCVTPKDIDAGVRSFAAFCAQVINTLMLGEETAEEWSIGGGV
ncbi:MAG: GPR endopeptidase [Clostridia bacterium]|nr:GPR endopeptidase [Clostridia bacterium]